MMNWDQLQLLEKRAMQKLAYQVNDFLDALDTVNKWCVAKIIDIKKNDNDIYQYHLHYVGWGDRWNEWLPMDSPRLAPYGISAVVIVCFFFFFMCGRTWNSACSISCYCVSSWSFVVELGKHTKDLQGTGPGGSRASDLPDPDDYVRKLADRNMKRLTAEEEAHSEERKKKLERGFPGMLFKQQTKK